jgi:uncharacterized 2Fe-2S/4Fe-4S cluster protein (DUF4445 family)
LPSFTVDFEPVGRRGEFNGEQPLLECARQLSVDIVSICGGFGSCEHCKVQVIDGQVSELTPEEEEALTTKELEQGYRLACMTYPRGNVKLHVPPESLTALQRTQVEGLEVDVEPDPPVRGLEIHLTPPTLASPQSDDENLWTALAKQDVMKGRIDFLIQQTLSRQIREHEWSLGVALRGDEIVAIDTPSTRWSQGTCSIWKPVEPWHPRG